MGTDRTSGKKKGPRKIRQEDARLKGRHFKQKPLSLKQMSQQYEIGQKKRGVAGGIFFEIQM